VAGSIEGGNELPCCIKDFNIFDLQCDCRFVKNDRAAWNYLPWTAHTHSTSCISFTMNDDIMGKTCGHLGDIND